MDTVIDRSRPPSHQLLWLELRGIWELQAFFAAYPLLRRAPRGDGHPVLVLPGLAAIPPDRARSGTRNGFRKFAEFSNLRGTPYRLTTLIWSARRHSTPPVGIAATRGGQGAIAELKLLEAGKEVDSVALLTQR